MANNVKALKDYFSTEDKPCTNQEMMEFWKSLSESDKEYYKNVSLD